MSIRRVLGIVGVCVWLGVLGGCEMLGGAKTEDLKTDQAAVKAADAPPGYPEMARRYNERIEPLNKMFARANIRLTYFDENGEKKTEEPEGRLQIVRPDRLALNLGKAGQILFWFGCDASQYWWFDLTDSSNRILAFGRHDRYNEEVGKRIGIAMRPLDLIRVLGIVPMDPKAPGATQWSRDRSQVGITTAIGARGFQRVWVDPRTDMPVSIEVFDSAKKLVVIAKHSGEEPIELASGRYRPPIAAQIVVTHIASKTEARLSLTGIKDSGVSEKAFQLPTLLESYPVDRQIDLDNARPGTKPVSGNRAAIQG